MANVLIADDSVVMTAILQYMVEKAGHKVVAAAKDGDEAVALYNDLQPDVVTLDVIMRGSDGLSALKAIKGADSTSKVIMVLEEGQEAEEAEARENGADGFLKKPFELNAVVEELARVLG